MSRPDDVPVEMTRHEIDDAAAEHLLRGSAAAGQEPLVLLLSQLRSMSSQAPQPSAALAAILRDGFTPEPSAAAPPVPEGSRWGRRFAAVAGMSLTVKVLAGTGVAVAAVGTAAGAGVLPEPVRDGVNSVVRTLTPFEIDSTGPAPTPSSPTRPAPVQPAPAVQPTPRPSRRPRRWTLRPAAPPRRSCRPAPGTGGPRPVPAPVAPGADRRPASPQAEQRPQQRSEAPGRPASPRPSPQGGSPGRERPEAPEAPESPAADARASSSPRR